MPSRQCQPEPGKEEDREHDGKCAAKAASPELGPVLALRLARGEMIARFRGRPHEERFAVAIHTLQYPAGLGAPSLIASSVAHPHGPVAAAYPCPAIASFATPPKSAGEISCIVPPATAWLAEI